MLKIDIDLGKKTHEVCRTLFNFSCEDLPWFPFWNFLFAHLQGEHHKEGIALVSMLAKHLTMMATLSRYCWKKAGTRLG